MSWHPAADPAPGDRFSCDAIETIIVPRAHDLGGFEVRRALPSSRRQMVGPFIFFDQMGPAEFLLGVGMDVRPHPHIGLSTVTYLFDGVIMHRDSLGTVLPIRPACPRSAAHMSRSEHKSEAIAEFSTECRWHASAALDGLAISSLVFVQRRL